MQPIRIELCAGTACHLMGSQQLLTVVETVKMQVEEQIQVRFTNCLEACGRGPSARINGILYSRLTEEQLLAKIKELLA